MVIEPQLHLVFHGRNAVREHCSDMPLPRLLVLGPRRRTLRVAVRIEVAVVRFWNQVTGVRKRRYPGVTLAHGVPADVIEMQMGVDDDIDG